MDETPGVKVERADRNRSMLERECESTEQCIRRGVTVHANRSLEIGINRSRQIRVGSSGGFPGLRCRMSETEMSGWGAVLCEIRSWAILEHRNGPG